jgi:hypothetical protein
MQEMTSNLCLDFGLYLENRTLVRKTLEEDQEDVKK